MKIADNSFFHNFTGNNAHLKLDHKYFYQVQDQLALCENAYCNFVCWTKNGLHAERM